jgi:hypothetical protein
MEPHVEEGLVKNIFFSNFAVYEVRELSYKHCILLTGPVCNRQAGKHTQCLNIGDRFLGRLLYKSLIDYHGLPCNKS